MEIIPYIKSYLSGLLPGLLLMVSVGPVFFSVINTSIRKGFHTALYFLAGISLSDIMFILLTNLGASQIITSQIKAVTYIGGIFLIIVGVYMFLKKYHMGDEDFEITQGTRWKYFLKGWVINTTYPGVLLFWTTNATLLAAKGFTRLETICYFAGVLTVVSISDVSKAYFAQKLKPILSPNVINWIYKISGLVMIGIGIFLIAREFFF